MLGMAGNSMDRLAWPMAEIMPRLKIVFLSTGLLSEIARGI